MNCFQVSESISTKTSKRKAAPSPLQNIPTILEIQDFSEYMKNRKESDAPSFFENSTSTATSSSTSHSSEPLRRLSFRLGSDADESNYNSSSSQRTTPSFSTGNYIFDFDAVGSQSRSSSGYSTPSPKVLSTGTHSAAPGAMFLEIPRDPFHTSFGPISNSHSSDKLVSNAAYSRPSLTTGQTPTLHVSRSCSMLTKGVFGGGKGARSGDRIAAARLRRRSSQTDHDEGNLKTGNDVSRKSSNSDNSGGVTTAEQRSIFTRLIHRWQMHLQQNDRNGSVPAHALFLRYGSSRKSGKKSTRSHSETEAVEKSVKQRLRQMVRRNTDSVLKLQQQKSPRCSNKSSNMRPEVVSNRPTPDDARSWQESFDTLLSSTYGTALFRAFLQLEYNEENLAFYLACEKFKRLDPTGHRKIAAKAQKIYDEFVRVEAPREVNLDSITRATTVTNLANPNRHCFDHAQRRVRHVLEKDVYPRFLKFDLYTQLLPGPEGTQQPKVTTLQA